MLGALLSLISAALFGMNIATLRRGVLGGSVLQALSITVPSGVPLFAIGCLLFGAFGAVADLTLDAWGWYTLAGIVHFVLGRYSNYRATRALGAAQSGPVVQLSLIVSLIFALALLGESLSVMRAIGIVFILIGPLIILRGHSRAGGTHTRAGQKLNYVEGYFWGFICALCFGASPILIRFGLEDGGIVESVAGGFASYVAAAVFLGLVILIVPSNRADVSRMEPQAAKWFCATGFLVFLSQLFLYMALALAPVSVVAAVQRTAVVFRVVFSWLLNRDHEVLGATVILGIAVSALGVCLMTISVEMVAEVIPLTPSIADTLNMSWPQRP